MSRQELSFFPCVFSKSSALLKIRRGLKVPPAPSNFLPESIRGPPQRTPISHFSSPPLPLLSALPFLPKPLFHSILNPTSPLRIRVRSCPLTPPFKLVFFPSPPLPPFLYSVLTFKIQRATSGGQANLPTPPQLRVAFERSYGASEFPVAS